MEIPERVQQWLYGSVQDGHNIKVHVNCSPYECRGVPLANEMQADGIPVVGAIYDENGAVEATITFPKKKERYVDIAENIHDWEKLFAETRNHYNGVYRCVIVSDSLPDEYLKHISIRYDPDADMKWHRFCYDIATQETTKLPIP